MPYWVTGPRRFEKRSVLTFKGQHVLKIFLDSGTGWRNVIFQRNIILWYTAAFPKHKHPQQPIKYEGYSKTNLRLVGKNKRVVIASKRTLSSNKELVFLLYAYPHIFSPRSVGVNTDRTWTLSSPLPPAVRYVL